MSDEEIIQTAQEVKGKLDELYGEEAPDMYQVIAAVRATTEIIHQVSETLSTTVIPAINSLLDSLYALDLKGLRRHAVKHKYGNPSNNYRKMHGQPMYRWRWLK